MLDKIKAIREEAERFDAVTPDEVEEFRIKHLGKKGTLTHLFDEFKTIPPSQKKEVGQELNAVKQLIQEKVNTLRERLSAESEVG